MGRAIRVVLLSLLLAVLAFIVYERGFGWRLGASPGRITGQYQSEEAWIVTEVARDIVEMSAYTGGKTVDVSGITPTRVSDGVYRFPSQGPLRAAVDVHLQKDVWDAGEFASIARGVLGTGTSSSIAAEAPGVHAALLDLTPDALLQASATTSAALTANMRNPRAHEAAALILGAFALREAARDFSDVRWSLNRMTAHLAMANALSPDAPAQGDRAIAEALLLTLANHQVRALTAIDELDKSTDPATQSWARALRLRLTQDWTVVEATPQSPLLERLEYFRARRATMPRTSARRDLEALGVMTADAEWLRILEAYPAGVEDKWTATNDGLAAERQETATVFAKLNDRTLPTSFAVDLNARAGRCVTDGKVQVLPWGAWAEFFQRHMALQVVHLQRFYKNTQGNDGGADVMRAELRDEFKKLTLFPIATAYWTKGPHGGEADLTYINEAIALASSSPELVTSRPWYFLEGGAGYEAVKHGMPPGAKWFVPISPRDPYDAGWRARYFTMPPDATQLATLMAEAPHDTQLAIEYARRQYGDAPAPGELIRVFGDALTHDMRAIDFVAARSTDAAERLALFERACRLSDVECASLGSELARAGRADEAAAQFEKAFADPDMDVVSMSNRSGWLVDYYYRHQQTPQAVALAERSAETGSDQGKVTAAYLYERLGRLDDAESAYRWSLDRYQNPAPLLGFYYRQSHGQGPAQYQKAWDEMAPSVFPEGLVPTSAGTAAPAHGVIVTKDSDRSRQAGLRAGDIIVGLEGWRVENLNQYRVVNTFTDSERMRLTVWRGKQFDVMFDAPNRLMGIEFRSYPIQGFSEQ